MHTTHDIWIGQCHLRDKPAAESIQNPIEYECFAAVWTNSREGFDAALRTHLEAEGKQLTWSREIHPVTGWLTRHGHNNVVIELARSVHQNHPIELGELTPLGEAGKPTLPPSYLTTIEHEIPPLPDQGDKPFWECEWIVPELKELLFGQPEGTAEQVKTYFIVDATLRKNVTGFFDLDQLELPIRCLFEGERAQELKWVAPYLIDMTLPQGAWDDKDLVPGFHKAFFKKHWGKNTGIFIRTSVPFEEVWGHFKRFVRIKDTDGKWYYFRFWEAGLIEQLSEINIKLIGSLMRSDIYIVYDGISKPITIKKISEKNVPFPTLTRQDIKNISGIFCHRRYADIANKIRANFPEYVEDIPSKQLIIDVQESINYAKIFNINDGVNIAKFTIMAIATVRGFHKEKDVVEMFDGRTSGDNVFLDICDVIKDRIKKINPKDIV